MDWTPEAKEVLKRVPPVVQKMAKKAVEAYAKNKGMGTVTEEILQEARAVFMGKSSRKEDKKSDLNIGVNKRQTMILTDDRHSLANETDDPLHDAFDRKMAVHAMPEYEPIRPEQLHEIWAEAMSGEEILPIRTIYIHIPFCETHCLFCGFYQNAYRANLAEEYVEELVREMELTANTPFTAALPFQAVYFGGGTPTSLSSKNISRLVSTVKRLFPLSNDCEITLEGRFYHFNREKIEASLDAGVNRFSLGVQTFDTQIRKSLGRREPGEKVIETLTFLRDLGDAVVIIDLIYGLPGQSLEIWENDIRTFLSIEIDGCDLYQLNVYMGGLLEKSVDRGILPRPATLKEQADYFVRGVKLMEKAHYRRLSISHWARTSRERSLYNLFSRGRSECIPIGSGAGGWIRNHTFFLDGDLQGYLRAVKDGQKPISLAFIGSERNFLFRDISYQIELGYCDLKDLSSQHNFDLFTIVEPIISQWEKVGLIELSDGCLYLTRPGEFWAVNLAQILIDRLQK
jgi:oxygen-independent coproporphyrinogen-3 oxidase